MCDAVRELQDDLAASRRRQSLAYQSIEAGPLDPSGQQERRAIFVLAAFPPEPGHAHGELGAHQARVSRHIE